MSAGGQGFEHVAEQCRVAAFDAVAGQLTLREPTGVDFECVHGAPRVLGEQFVVGRHTERLMVREEEEREVNINEDD